MTNCSQTNRFNFTAPKNETFFLNDSSNELNILFVYVKNKLVKTAEILFDLLQEKGKHERKYSNVGAAMSLMKYERL